MIMVGDMGWDFCWNNGVLRHSFDEV